MSFRAFVGYAYTDGVHNNDRAIMFFSKRKIEEKAGEIYLTYEELQALYKMPRQASRSRCTTFPSWNATRLSEWATTLTLRLIVSQFRPSARNMIIRFLR